MISVFLCAFTTNLDIQMIIIDKNFNIAQITSLFNRWDTFTCRTPFKYSNEAHTSNKTF